MAEEKKTASDQAAANQNPNQLAYTAILGGTNGLGAEIAKIYQARGEPTITLGRTVKPVLTGTEDPKDIRIRMDLSDASGINRFASELQAAVRVRNGRLQRFFWVAGMLVKGKFEEMGVRDLLCVIDVNLRNALPMVQAGWKLLNAGGDISKRSLVVIASTTGLSPEPNPLEQAYAATKAAQVSFARALGGQAGDPRAKVALFCPGGMQTGFWHGMPNMDLKDFLDPAKVAQAIVDDVEKQESPFFERTIKRGSL